MSKGAIYPAAWRTFEDRYTGVRITQLTAHKAHSHHLYFTNPGWYDHGRRLLFGSERGNRVNLYSLDLMSGEITQLTDLDQPPPLAETSFLFASVNPVRPEVYFWHGRDLVALDLHTLDERRIYRAPERFLTNITNVTADGRYVCTGLYEDLSDRFAIDLLHGYVGFVEYWEARPRSQIVRINVDNGDADIVFEEQYWIGHVNTSPTLPDILTYCHEGPWQKVDNRIWGLDLTTGKTGCSAQDHPASAWDTNTGLPTASISVTTGAASRAHPSTVVSGTTTLIGSKRHFRQTRRTFTVMIST